MEKYSIEEAYMSAATENAHSLPHGIAHQPAKLAGLAFPILAAARETALLAGSSYAGDVTPQQAWELYSSGIAELVDVRTDKELSQIGYVLDAKHVEWLKSADMSKNSRFLYELGTLVNKNDIVLFLCRSGKRSVAAAQAATEAGYRNAFNVLEGFEGDGNPQQGWLNRGLPSAQY
jgi:rhodanese-related sulfurtransferase